MSDVVFDGSADFSGVEKAFAKLGKENLRLLQQLDKLAAANNKGAKLDQANKAKSAALAREANAMTERSRTPVQKYNQELAKVRDHMTKNRISAETFRAEKQRLIGILQRETGAVKAVKGSYIQLEKELADQVKKMHQLKDGTAVWAKQKAKVDQLRSSLDRVKRASAGVNKEVKKGDGKLDGALKSIGLMAAGYFTVQGAIQAVNFELEKKARLEKDAADKELTLEAAIAKNLPNIAVEDRSRYRETVREEAYRLGVSQEDYANVSGTAISAGAGNLDRAKEILETLFKVTAGNAEQANALGGAALDFTRLAGNDDIEGAIGQLAASQQWVRATDMATFGKNIAPAIASATSTRENVDAISVERGIELGAVISQILKDPDINVTATALNQLVSKMDSFVPEAGERQELEAKIKKEEETLAKEQEKLTETEESVSDSKKGSKSRKAAEKRVAKQQKKVAEQEEKIAGMRSDLETKDLSSVTPEQIAAFKSERSFDKRMQMLNADPTLAKQFTSDLKEGKMKTALYEIVTGADRAKELDRAISADIPAMAAGRENYESLQASVLDETKNLRADRKAKAIEEYHQTDGTRPIVGQARKVFDSMLTTVNLPGPDKIAELAHSLELEGSRELGVNPIQAMIDKMETLATIDSNPFTFDVSEADSAKMRDLIEVLKGHLEDYNRVKAEQAAAALPAPAAEVKATTPKLPVIDAAKAEQVRQRLNESVREMDLPSDDAAKLQGGLSELDALPVGEINSDVGILPAEAAKEATEQKSMLLDMQGTEDAVAPTTLPDMGDTAAERVDLREGAPAADKNAAAPVDMAKVEQLLQRIADGQDELRGIEGAKARGAKATARYRNQGEGQVA